MSPDIEFALVHTPAHLRAAMDALFAIDTAMADVVARSSDPTLGRIKLAWWREQLGKLDGGPPPAEPRLQAVAEHLLPAGVSGAELAELEAGWATLLDPEIDGKLIEERGRALFMIGGKLLGSSDPKLGEAGALYALATAGLETAEALGRIRGHRFERSARPLTMLARAAVRPGPQGSRGRMLAMLAHRWSGKIA